MRVLLIASDRVPFWLIGDPTRNERDVVDGRYSDSQTLDETLQVTRNQQTVTGPEWQAQAVFDRGNGGVRYEFRNHKIFPTEEALMDYLTELAAVREDDELHRWQGDIWLRTVGQDGAYSDRLLPDAAVTLAGTRRDGAVGLHLTYRITAPGFDPAESRMGTEGVFLLAEGILGGVCELVVYGTTSGGAWDSATSVFAGTAPAALTADTILDLEIGDNNGVVTTKSFQVVAPGGTASGGRIALETPVINNWQTVVDALEGIANIQAYATTKGSRKVLLLGWTAPPISGASDVFIRFTADNSLLGFSTIYYGAGSTAAAFNAVSIDGVSLQDADGTTIMADTD